jgi:hypothetical protein
MGGRPASTVKQAWLARHGLAEGAPIVACDRK